jgi:2-hydroxychromene-2-carboxylate isomerase
MADVDFFWDPVCPWAWITSRWIEEVAAQKDLDVDWRFISLRIVNEHRDYGAEFPQGYPAAHGAGLSLLRIAAQVRAEAGREHLGGLYTAVGNRIHVDREGVDIRSPEGVRSLLGEVGPMLERLGLDPALAEAADDTAWDDDIRRDTATALERAGKEVGTPVITFQPPDGPSFFGPVISRIPRGAEAVELWDAVTTLAVWPGFAELKRAIRERPQTS